MFGDICLSTASAGTDLQPKAGGCQVDLNKSAGLGTVGIRFCTVEICSMQKGNQQRLQPHFGVVLAPLSILASHLAITPPRKC